MSEERAVRIFSARACARPLSEAAGIFTEKTGIEVQISQCDRHCASPVAEEAVEIGANHDFLVEIAEDGIYDLAIGGADYLLDDGEIQGIVRKGERRFIAARRSAIVVPKGNPARISSLKDLAKPGIDIAISVIDCCKGMWEDVTVRQGLTDAVRRNISFYANGCVALVEAVASRGVDAAFGWSAFSHLDEERIDIVDLPPEQQVWRATSVALLSTAGREGDARRFMDFLASPEAVSCYVKYGWAAPSGV